MLDVYMDASLLLGQYDGANGYDREKVVELFIFVGGGGVEGGEGCSAFFRVGVVESPV